MDDDPSLTQCFNSLDFFEGQRPMPGVPGNIKWRLVLVVMPNIFFCLLHTPYFDCVPAQYLSL